MNAAGHVSVALLRRRREEEIQQGNERKTKERRKKCEGVGSKARISKMGNIRRNDKFETKERGKYK